MSKEFKPFHEDEEWTFKEGYCISAFYYDGITEALLIGSLLASFRSIEDKIEELKRGLDALTVKTEEKP